MATSTPTPPKVFLDSSAFFAAAYSARGSARDLLLAATQGRVRLVLSAYVIEETERNLLANAPHLHAAFVVLRDDLPYQLSDPPDRLIATVARTIEPKDAPIVAGAMHAGARFLATYDRRHLLAHAGLIQTAFGVAVATPEAVLAGL